MFVFLKTHEPNVQKDWSSNKSNKATYIQIQRSQKHEIRRSSTITTLLNPSSCYICFMVEVFINKKLVSWSKANMQDENHLLSFFLDSGVPHYGLPRRSHRQLKTLSQFRCKLQAWKQYSVVLSQYIHQYFFPPNRNSLLNIIVYTIWENIYHLSQLLKKWQSCWQYTYNISFHKEALQSNISQAT